MNFQRQVNAYTAHLTIHADLFYLLLLKLSPGIRTPVRGQNNERNMRVVCLSHSTIVVTCCSRRGRGNDNRLMQLPGNSKSEKCCAPFIDNRIALKVIILLNRMDEWAISCAQRNYTICLIPYTFKSAITICVFFKETLINPLIPININSYRTQNEIMICI